MWSDAFKTHIINLYKAAARRPFLCNWTKKQKKHKCLVHLYRPEKGLLLNS